MVFYCNWKFCGNLGPNVRSVLAMPIPRQMPEAVYHGSFGICSESITKWGSKPFVSFFCICKASTVIFSLPQHYLFLFSSVGLLCFFCIGTILLLLNLFAFIFSRKPFFRATTFSARFCVLNKSFATTGVRTQEDYCPLDLKSNALTTRP